MPIIPNQGFRRDLNFAEPINDTTALNNLGGAGIANDLRIIQNNLRNKDVLKFSDSTSNYNSATGVYSFPDLDLIFTNDDEVTVATDVPGVGSVGFLTAGNLYYVVNSDGTNNFALSERPSTHPLGVSTITGAIAGITTINFVRNTPVTFDNTKNFIEPNLLSGYRFVRDLNASFNTIQANNDFAKFDITRKFKGNESTFTDDPFKTEGVVIVNDPVPANTSPESLLLPTSPGVFIGTTRAFSSDNNPWEKIGDALETESNFISIANLVIDGLSNNSSDEAKTINAGSNATRNNIRINGVTVEDISGVNASDFTHKLPIVVNGETFYMLMTTDS